jgi:hypothetical protein
VTFTVTADDPTLFAVQPALDATGTLTYTPAADAYGTTTIHVTATDSAGATSTEQTAQLTITAVNDPPAPGDDAYLVDLSSASSVQGTFAQLVANDNDNDGDTLTVTGVDTTTASGLATVTVDLVNGTFTYTPDIGYTGTDQFSYTVSDGTTTATGTITVTVSSTVSTASYWFAPGAPSSGQWSLTNAPPSLVTYDYDGDLRPGLTVKKSDGKPTTDVTKYRDFAFTPAVATTLNGPVTLELWTSVALADFGKDGHLYAYVDKCDLSGTTCTQLTKTDLHTKQWDQKLLGWGKRTFALGNVSTTVGTNEMLRVRIQFNHIDVYVAMGTDGPSRLLLPIDS